MRNQFKRRFAKENQGSMIGRPKKPPIMGAEKSDGKMLNLIDRGWFKNIYLSCLGLWQIIPRFLFSEKTLDDTWGKASKKYWR